MKPHFKMMAAYNRWANERIYHAVSELDEDAFMRDLGLAFGSVCRTLNHLVVTDRIWMKRFTNTGESYASLDTQLFAELTPLRAARNAEDERIAGWIERLSEADVAGRFTYVTVTDMRTVSQRLAPALAHLFNHQTHHRGQVHAALTRLGQPSTALDLIYFQRTEDGRQFA